MKRKHPNKNNVSHFIPFYGTQNHRIKHTICWYINNPQIYKDIKKRKKRHYSSDDESSDSGSSSISGDSSEGMN